MDNATKTRENFYRRMAGRLGLQLEKSRGRKWNVNNRLGYRIIDPDKNIIVMGEKYDLTLDQVISYLEEAEKAITQ